MKRFCFLALALFFASIPALAQSSRIATFDQTSIVVAYYRSSLWSDTIKAKQSEFAEAQKAGDTTKANALQAWGEQSQQLAHRQLDGKAPINNVMDALRPAFDEIENTAHVSSVVPFSSAINKADSVDVTGQLLDWLKADEKTRELIQQIPQKPN